MAQNNKHLQQRYFLWALRDALGILNNQEDGFHVNFEENVSFGIFYHFIKCKKQCAYQRDIPDISCLYEVWKNAAMMAKAIRKQKSGHPTMPTTLSKNTRVIQMIQNAWKTFVKPVSQNHSIIGCRFTVIGKRNRSKWIESRWWIWLHFFHNDQILDAERIL